MNEELIREFLDRRNVFAVVGASRDPQKYGYQVYRDLKSAGYKVYPVNPNAQEVLGDKCYPSLKELPAKPDVVVTVVPPQVTELVVEECKELGVRKIWMQPGSESERAVEYCEKNNIAVVHGACIMIERKRRL
ncbi:MAG: CoA-binding protein [Candidatus Nezhaarchaeales archaeon]|nr:MAG: CoA-binding protein [Candidatus Nezhaarchaeota archaeon WYZ-LMO8]TDA36262.1 MAG: CoA-binding protein [Candidatus Nezhaarchaeota archaeon WYZ-LMO7]